MNSREMTAFVRKAKARGWNVERTGTDHLKFTHPDGAYPVFGSGSPSCGWAIRNIMAAMRRVLRGQRP